MESDWPNKHQETVDQPLERSTHRAMSTDRNATGDGGTSKGENHLAGKQPNSDNQPISGIGSEEIFEAPDGYQLQEFVGAGGMGIVYRAFDKQLKRKIALKFLRQKYARDSETAGRFLEEAKITAQLQHPGIPAIHEVGEVNGRPFIAMKLIRGKHLGELLPSNEKPRSQATVEADLANGMVKKSDYLAIFEAICQAVGYAHSRDVVHRDLKPQNVMVGAFGEVQVMDWGLAKVLTAPDLINEDSEENAGKTLTRIDSLRAAHSDATVAGSVIGTPAYMAPEQAIGAVDKLDTRTDVFGLGGILCAMLTGDAPFQGKSSEEVRQLAAAGRLSNAFERLNQCDADPEWVELCKRCLATEQDNRPNNAAVVASLVTKLRNDADERARLAEIEEETAKVKIREQQKQRRGLIIGSCIGMSLLLAGIIGTSAGLWRAETQRTLAEQARVDEARQRSEAEKQRNESLIQRAEAEKQSTLAAEHAQDAENRTREYKAVLEFVEKHVFAAARPKGQDGGLGHDVTLKASILSAIDDIDSAFDGTPLLAARVREILGTSMAYLGESDIAFRLKQEAWQTRKEKLGADDPLTLTSLENLAIGYYDLSRFDEAADLFEQALTVRETEKGRQLPNRHISMGNLANAYFALGRVEEAAKLYQETYELRTHELGPNHADTLWGLVGIATAEDSLGKLDDACAHFEDAYQQMKIHVGPEHPRTLWAMMGLANAYSRLGRHEESAEFAQQMESLMTQVLGPDHPDTLRAQVIQATALGALGQHESANQIRKRTLEIRNRKLGPKHAETLETMHDLANGFNSLGQIKAATELHEQSLVLLRETMGEEAELTIWSMNNLAGCLHELGRYAEAAELWETTLDIRQRSLGNEHPETVWNMDDLVSVFADQQRFEEANQMAANALASGERAFGDEALEIIYLKARRATTLAQAGKQTEAIKALDEVNADPRLEQLGPAEFAGVIEARLRLARASEDLPGCRSACQQWEQRATAQEYGPREWYQAACFRTVAAQLATLLNQPKSGEAEGVGDDTDKGLEWLNKAMELGYVNADGLKSNPDLEFLRAHEGFIELVKKMETNRDRP